jgi:hypothetical protein
VVQARGLRRDQKTLALRVAMPFLPDGELPLPRGTARGFAGRSLEAGVVEIALADQPALTQLLQPVGLPPGPGFDQLVGGILRKKFGPQAGRPGSAKQGRGSTGIRAGLVGRHRLEEQLPLCRRHLQLPTPLAQGGPTRLPGRITDLEQGLPRNDPVAGRTQTVSIAPVAGLRTSAVSVRARTRPGARAVTSTSTQKPAVRATAVRNSKSRPTQGRSGPSSASSATAVSDALDTGIQETGVSGETVRNEVGMPVTVASPGDNSIPQTPENWGQ